jgi:hypothetical protein
MGQADQKGRLGSSRPGVVRVGRKAAAWPKRSKRTPTRWKVAHMRGILLWLVGIPIPIIILLYLFNIL